MMHVTHVRHLFPGFLLFICTATACGTGEQTSDGAFEESPSGEFPTLNVQARSGDDDQSPLVGRPTSERSGQVLLSAQSKFEANWKKMAELLQLDEEATASQNPANFEGGTAIEIAERLEREARAQDNIHVLTILGAFYVRGVGLPKNVEKAATLFKPGVDRRHPGAQAEVGRMYHYGLITGEKNPEAAIQYYTMAIEKEYGPALTALSCMMEEGAGVPRDPVGAHALALRAAARHNLSAIFNLGISYENGSEVTAKNYALAKQFYELGAARKHGPSLVNLGWMQYKGYGMMADREAAAQSFMAAAEEGYPPGIYNLARMYQNGHGVRRDWNRAAFLYEMAAERGVKQAAEDLVHLQSCPGMIHRCITSVVDCCSGMTYRLVASLVDALNPFRGGIDEE